jgi:ATP-binding cassette subfamily F protein uup
VSHDREFLNNVVTSTIEFEAGQVREYVGGYDDWLRQRPEPLTATLERKRTPAKEQPQPTGDEPPSRKRRLAYHEQRELASLPATIETLDTEIADLHGAMAQPGFYRQPSSEIASKQSRLNELEQQLAAAYRRWEQLESLEP